jgi:hypothetical protein
MKDTVDRATVAELVDAVPLGSEPSVAYVARSLRDLNAVIDSLGKLGLKADLNIDIQLNRVELSTLDASEAAAAIGAAGLTSDGLVVQEVPALSAPATNLYGGLGGSGNGWSGCPSGFTVQQRVGGPDDFIYGFVSAGHCGTTMSYLGVGLPFVASCFTGGCDSQWHTEATFTAQPSFYWTGGLRRNVTSTTTWLAIVVGGTVCHYGPVTGYGCGTVNTKSLAPNYVPHPHAVFVKAGNNCSSDLVQPGDSGGPIFYGNTAYGIMSRYYTDIFCLSHTQMIFDAIDLATNPYSGVSVMLYP